MKILVVEKIFFLITIVSQTLRRMGHEVDEAPSASIALRFLQEYGPYEVSFVALEIPSCNSGEELLEVLSQHHPKTKVVLMAGNYEKTSKPYNVVLGRPPHHVAVRRALAEVMRI